MISVVCIANKTFRNNDCLFLKGVFAKNERVYRLNDKKALLIATNLTSICCVYKEKIVKDISYRITWRSYKLRKLQHTT